MKRIIGIIVSHKDKSPITIDDYKSIKKMTKGFFNKPIKPDATYNGIKSYQISIEIPDRKERTKLIKKLNKHGYKVEIYSFDLSDLQDFMRDTRWM